MFDTDELRKNPNAPALRGDLSDLYDALVEAIHDSQTHILGAFYGFSNTLNARHKSQTTAQRSTEERLSVLEDRIMELEQRLNQQ